MLPPDPDRIRRQINQRLSLRAPQERSLEILHDVLQLIDPAKEIDLDAALKAVQGSYSGVEAFERDFPSLCFSLATGVGKTRLMGAFMAYLALTGRSQNFFVLAPNTTIYDKLIDDISNTSSPKYVFRGIAQFAQTPPVIHGRKAAVSATLVATCSAKAARLSSIFSMFRRSTGSKVAFAVFAKPSAILISTIWQACRTSSC